MSQQLRDWAKEALEMLNDNHHLVADNEKHAYVMLHLEVIERGKALLEQPAPAQEPDHGDELTIAYLDGVHTGKQIAKREWVDLEEIDFVGINQSCLTKMQAAAAAARLLKEKNT
jgi:regulator of replication initiation timing